MKNTSHHLPNKWKLGFSLLELMVVIILVAGFIAIAIPTLSSLTGVETKTEVTKVAGLVSEVYGRAALSGMTHRIIFDLDDNKYWVEIKEGEAGDISPELGYDELMKDATNKSIASARDEGKDKYTPKFSKATGRLGEEIELKKGLIIHGAWNEQMSEVSRTGRVAIYFFSGGYTQTSFISLAEKDNEDSAIYVAVSALTGAITIEYGEPIPSELLSEERDS